MTKSDLNKEKKAAAEKAVEFIESGMLVGLGTGSTVKFLIESLAEKVKNELIKGISDIRDESSSEGMRVIFELKRDANPSVVKNQLIKHSENI